MKVRLYLHTGMVGGMREDIIDIPDKEIANMTSGQLEEHLDGYAEDHMANHIDYGYEVLDD